MPTAGLAILLFLAAPLAAQTPAPEVPVDPYQAAVTQTKSQDWAFRLQGASQLGQQRRPEAVPVLLPMLGDARPEVRAAAANALGLLRAGSATAKIGELLRKDPDAAVRSGAATALAYIGDPSAGDDLIAAVADADSNVRMTAVRVLGVMRVRKGAPALIAVLKDPDPAARREAAVSLGRMQAAESAPALKDLVKDPDESVRLEAIKALGSVSDPTSAPELYSALHDAKLSVRLAAALAFANVGNSTGTPVALQALKDKEPASRQQGASVLRAVGDPKRDMPALDAAFAAEKDAATKSVIDFARVQLKAKAGLKNEPAAPEVAVSSAPAKAAGPSKRKSGTKGAKKKKAAAASSGTPQ